MIILCISDFVVYKKHYPPALDDEVWRLEKIGKDGSFHKRLNKANIFTVEHFLRLVVKEPQKLRNVRKLISYNNLPPVLFFLLVNHGVHIIVSDTWKWNVK